MQPIAREVKEVVKRIPVLGGIAKHVYGKLPSRHKDAEPFPGSEAYWEARYSAGGDSGPGSYGRFAAFKAEVINDFVASYRIRSIIEFGCGDGNQISLANYPNYIGFDVSRIAIARCRSLFQCDNSKHFSLISEYNGETADLALSLDVIYHLVEDTVYYGYMQRLFDAANRYVIIYSSDCDDGTIYEGDHIKHRKFTAWIADNQPNWALVEHVPNRYPYRGDCRTGERAEFFIYTLT